MDLSSFPKNIEITDDYVRMVKEVKRDFIKAAKEKKERHKKSPDYEGEN